MNQEELDLLKENLEEQKKTNRILKIILGIIVMSVILIIIGCIFILPKITTLLDAFNEMTTQLQPIVSGMKDFDYTSLNEAISQLNDAISSLNRFLAVFH